ncbi:MAG: UvrB/UvrC motif-containing protein [Oscillospiraceae bacterium]|nr:UvrB/UvrC motif-containing protein [Oscillospiraceae bacterium]
MKCQKCGKNEVNFHYSQNVNGCVTETHLCSACAAESGYDIDQMFETGMFTGFGSNPDLGLNGLLEALFPVRSNVSGFIPLAIPMIQTNQMFPYTGMQRRGIAQQEQPCSCGCGQNVFKNPDVKVDEVMSKRRELNAQMRVAVANEEFEKAAVLRDEIKALESAGAEQSVSSQEAERNVKCDSETSSQDSPGAQ